MASIKAYQEAEEAKKKEIAIKKINIEGIKYRVKDKKRPEKVVVVKKVEVSCVKEPAKECEKGYYWNKWKCVCMPKFCDASKFRTCGSDEYYNLNLCTCRKKRRPC